MIALFSEIVMVETLARTRLTRVLPRGMELSHFMVLNHFARLGGEKTPAQLARVFHVTKGAMTNTVGAARRRRLRPRPPRLGGRPAQAGSRSAPPGVAARDRAVEAIAPVFDDVVAALGLERMRAALPIAAPAARAARPGLSCGRQWLADWVYMEPHALSPDTLRILAGQGYTVGIDPDWTIWGEAAGILVGGRDLREIESGTGPRFTGAIDSRTPRITRMRRRWCADRDGAGALARGFRWAVGRRAPAEPLLGLGARRGRRVHAAFRVSSHRNRVKL